MTTDDLEQSNDLVEFLLRETGETLYIVVQYDPESWNIQYVNDAVRQRIAVWEVHFDQIVDEFRRDAERNAKREQLFEVGNFYCSLHVFNDLVIIHFSQPDGHGVIFGYDPQAASNLTSFVALCLPRIRQHSLEELPTNPTW